MRGDTKRKLLSFLCRKDKMIMKVLRFMYEYVKRHGREYKAMKRERLSHRLHWIHEMDELEGFLDVLVRCKAEGGLPA